jgi:hypothetical protein
MYVLMLCVVEGKNWLDEMRKNASGERNLSGKDRFLARIDPVIVPIPTLPLEICIGLDHLEIGLENL